MKEITHVIRLEVTAVHRLSDESAELLEKTHDSQALLLASAISRGLIRGDVTLVGSDIEVVESRVVSTVDKEPGDENA